MNSVFQASTLEILTARPGSSSEAAMKPHQKEMRKLVRAGIAVLLFGLLPAFLWMSFAPLASAVVSPGFVKVDLDKRPVQHAEGGTVREVLVRDGQRVNQGDPLLILGDVSVDADQNRVNYRVLSEQASLVRLEAEQAAQRTLVFPADLERAAGTDARLKEHMAKERSLFEARRDALTGQIGLLRQQQSRIASEKQALADQLKQAGESLRYQREELETNRNLLKDGFISATRIAQLEATVADYRVKLEERRSELLRADQRIGDADLRIKSLESEYRQQASDQLKIASTRLAEIQQEQRKSTDAAKRQVVVAPATGDVLNLRFTSPGSVVGPREPIADIVPAHPKLVIEARLRTEDVTRVHQGQSAEIRFTAFKYRTTKLVPGKVIYLSPDRIVDRAINATYYVTLIEVDADALAAAGDMKLQAGMPAEIYIRGEDRTALQYLLEPLTQVMLRAGRER